MRESYLQVSEQKDFHNVCILFSNLFLYSFPVCPMKSAPVMYSRAAFFPNIPNDVMTCPQTCTNQTIS